ncbi:CopG family ribbon-helix-helix protein [Sphingomonas sp.]|jgi:predicted transcriptional regulator|uniref:CopG family ribbon-helix-helix protein n=1 Tax=Sphingomonas sp. TaxID=28214 RepID=UPI002E0ECA47|nr:ribbon-helix-helix protein, CopG family [Sphingomonas sp.]HEV7289030.1 ribbon-helix-helix protein, CopG family [Sphingomonas sp.]
MSKTTVITARLEPELLAKLDALASEIDRSRAWVVAKAVQRYVEEELEYRAFIQAGIDSADRGELVSQEDMEAWFEARHRQAAAAE